MAEFTPNSTPRVCTRSISKKIKKENLGPSGIKIEPSNSETSVTEFLDVRDIILDKPIPKAATLQGREPFVMNIKSRERFDHKLDEIYDHSEDDIVSAQEWSVKEKRQLINAIKKFGFFDIAKIKTFLPNKKESEIRDFIQTTGKKVEKEMEKEDSPQQMESALLSWSKVMVSAIEPNKRRDDFSMVLSEVMDHISQGEFPSPTEEPGTPDFAAIYGYLRELLAGRVPPFLGDVDSWTITQALDTALELPNRIQMPKEMHDRLKAIGENPAIVEAFQPVGPRTLTEQALQQLSWLNPLRLDQSHLDDIREQIHFHMDYDNISQAPSSS